MATGRQILPASVDGTDEWKAQRLKGLGGSDMASIWTGRKTHLEVWESKLGIVQPEVVDERTQAIFDFGHEREPFLRKAAATHFGVHIRNTGTWQHKQDRFALANPDGLVGSDGLLEIKTTGGFTDDSKEWRSGRVPAYAWVQAHWYAYVTGRTRLFFAAEIDRQQVFLGPYEADQDLIGKLVSTARPLWGAVVLKAEPAAEPAKPRPVPYQAPVDGGEVILDPASPAVAWVDKLRSIKAEMKRLKAEEEVFTKEVKALLGDATVLRDEDGGVLVTWKPGERRSIDKKLIQRAGLNPGDFEKVTATRTFLVKERAA